MTPTKIRTLLDAKPRQFGYTIAEYDCTKGTFYVGQIKSNETLMRIEQPGQQFEQSFGGTSFSLITKGMFEQYFQIFMEARKLNGYAGPLPNRIY